MLAGNEVTFRADKKLYNVYDVIKCTQSSYGLTINNLLNLVLWNRSDQIGHDRTGPDSVDRYSIAREFF